jgi:lipoprotein-anchoring transpeptidase ErfK/SrfK
MKRALSLSLALCALAVLSVPASAAALQVGPGGQPLRALGADPLPTPTLTLSATPPIVPFGGSTKLRGTIKDLGGTEDPGVAVSLTEMPAGAADFTDVATNAVDSKGAYSFTVEPALNTTYHVSFAGDTTWGPATSPDVLVGVRPQLTFKAPTSLWQHQQRTFKGSATPAMPGAQVTIEFKKDGVWENWRTATLSAKSKLSQVWKPTDDGIDYFRLSFAGDDSFAAVTTPSQRVIVNHPNKYSIPITYPHYFVIDHSEFRLYYYESGHLIKRWNCVLGKPSTPTPMGHFHIYQKQAHPEVGEGPWILYYYGPIGIHGTTAPGLLKLFPRAFSHGCCRLYNWQISWLAPRIPIGTPVWNVP